MKRLKDFKTGLNVVKNLAFEYWCCIILFLTALQLLCLNVVYTDLFIKC